MKRGRRTIEQTERGFSVVGLVFIILVAILVLALGGAFIWYKTNTSPVQDNEEKVLVEIESGSGVVKIAEKLEEKGVIRNADAFKIYMKLKGGNKTLQAGKYELSKNMTLDQIIDTLSQGKILDETVKLTFIEGNNMRYVAEMIAKNTNNTEDDVFDLLEDEDYLDSLVEGYWFIEDDIEDEDIYYALEGYLYPDTYEFANKDVTVKEIFEKMLNKMGEVLLPMKEDIEDSDYSIHELLTIASIAEKEALNDEDRSEVAGVFYNRLKRGMALQSDVTTYYGLKIDDWSNRDLSSSELNKANAYNTRASSMAGKLPVGPICMVSKSAINAAVNPTKTKAYFFVADKNGKLYFSNTNDEHDEMVQELKSKGLWYEYDD